MKGYIDLHCHWIFGIDDGARTIEQSIEMLRGLNRIGFDTIVATPHMRPGLFDNDRPALEAAYARTIDALGPAEGLPELALSSEHYFDDVVFRRLMDGSALPYPGGRAALLEFYQIDFPPMVAHRLFDLRRRQVLPVIAHPERYQCLWKNSDKLRRLLDEGAVAQLDLMSLTGRYGRRPRRCAEALLDEGLYQIACSDAHRPADVDEVGKSIELLAKRYGEEEVDFLLRQGPREILSGRVSA
jgi:protein-tyrosine phosphatase